MRRLAPLGLVTRPCAAVDCQQENEIGFLCYEHQGHAAADVAQDLSEVGYLARDVRVNVSEAMYLTFTDSTTRKTAFQSVHRVMMREFWGRPLTNTENVHHINGVKWDNSLANLELWITSQPPGQRPHDLAQHARQLLARYGTAAEQEQFGAR